METSETLARLIGPVMAIAGIGVVFNHSFLRQMIGTMSEQRGLLFVVGILALSLGVALVNFHNVWVADWPVLITLLGWLSILGGLVRVLVPGIALNFAERVSAGPYLTIAGSVYALYGLALSYYGYLV